MASFYDKVALKFGGYGFSNNEPEFTSEYPNGNPEAIFKDKVISVSTKSSKALDVGCGDGIFAFDLADNFSDIVGIDSSKELLVVAENKKLELKNKNISFVYGDACAMPFQDGTFDVIYNRRGPSFYNEYARILKNNGFYVEIGIGEKDAMTLKQIFGRGQNYGEWQNSRLNKDTAEFKKLGFDIIFAKDFIYSELYASREQFELFLEGVPIFEDFDTVKDSSLLQEYYSTHTKDGQVGLGRHRVVYVIKK